MYARLAGGTILWPIASSPHTKIKSPFYSTIWNFNLRDYPDQPFVHHLLSGIDNGINIGFTGNLIFRVFNNHSSALSNATAIASELERELSLNRKLGPFLSPQFTNFIGSPIPKKHSEPVRWHLIHDLSWPPGHSVNDYIPKELYMYCIFPKVCNISKGLGCIPDTDTKYSDIAYKTDLSFIDDELLVQIPIPDTVTGASERTNVSNNRTFNVTLNK